MAIIKAARDGTDLRRVIAYVLRHGKVSPELVGGWNVDPANTANEMMTTKRANGKTSGRAYKHYIQSFHPNDNVTPEQAQEMAAELVTNFPLFRDHEVLYVTHADKDHIHTHIIVNSVAIEKEKPKLNCPPSVLQDLKDLSDEIIVAHGLPIEQERGETENVTTWDRNLYQVLSDAHAGRCQSWMYDAAVAVQAAMAEAADRDAFIRRLQDNGYDVRWGAKTTTYITPDGQRVRADRLERIFKLPSAREQYGDRQADQEQLREALHNVQPRGNRPREREGHAIDYAKFAVDLENPETRSYTEEEIEHHLYEAACAVCRQMRAAQTAADFYRGMRQSRFRIRYDKSRREYWIRIPYTGKEVSATELEQRFHMPSVRQAVVQLHRRARVQEPEWDGLIGLEGLDRTMTQRGWENVLMGKKWSGLSGHSGSRGQPPLSDRCASLQLYIYSDSPMPDYELYAAAMVLSQGICDPDNIYTLLNEHGYALCANRAETYLLTPHGRRIIIDNEPPACMPGTGPIYSGCIEVTGSGYMRYRGRRRSSASDVGGLIGLVVEAAAFAVSVVELAGAIIESVVGMFCRKHNRKATYTIKTDKSTITLDEAMKQAGIEVQFQEKVPAGVEPRNTMTPEQVPGDSVTSARKTRSERQQDMEELLGIVQQASAATDRESFVDLLAQQGCDVRWTERGTLTFVLPNGHKIRANKLEKAYRLPSISAAYGQERTPPKSGPRVEAAKQINTAAAATNSRDTFDAILTDAGYQVEWKLDGSDATVIHPNGQHMRLSSLMATFKIQPREVLSGVQTARITEPETGDEIDRLRDAIAAADRSLKAAAAGSVARGEGRDHQRTGSADHSLAARSRKAKRRQAEDERSLSAEAGRSKKSRRSQMER